MFKKIAFSAAVVFSIASMNCAFAGGPDVAPDATPVTYSGVYLEGLAGYDFRDWGKVADFTGISTSNETGGFSGGFDLGYQFNQYFSLEAGWLYLPQLKETLGNNTDKISNWAAYGGFKVQAPILVNRLYAFAKLAAAYNYAKASGNNVVGVNYNGNNNYWTPLYAFGLQYYFNENLSIGGEYVNIPGLEKINTASKRTPNSNIILFTLGYKFAI